MRSFADATHPKSVLNAMSERIRAKTRKLNQSIKPVETFIEGASKGLQFMPIRVQSAILEPLLNNALKAMLSNGDLDFLEGHCCAIAVRERSVSWHIGYDGVRLTVIPEVTPDVTISATVPAFLSLVSQHTDPDTLFFQRQLSIDGDVELGLFVKNLLDALDEDDLPWAWQKSLRGLRQLIEWEGTPA